MAVAAPAASEVEAVTATMLLEVMLLAAAAMTCGGVAGSEDGGC